MLQNTQEIQEPAVTVEYKCSRIEDTQTVTERYAAFNAIFKVENKYAPIFNAHFNCGIADINQCKNFKAELISDGVAALVLKDSHNCLLLVIHGPVITIGIGSYNGIFAANAAIINDVPIGSRESLLQFITDIIAAIEKL